MLLSPCRCRHALAPAPLPSLQVERTRSQQLPVYTDFRNGHTRVLTLVRRVSGDTDALRDELSRVLGGAEVAARPGRLEVQGNRVAQLKMWLMGLGF